jgi:hypothetical protein
MNVLCFDIETIPDTEFGRRIYELGDLDDEAVAKVMRFKQLQARQTDFLPLPQHQVVVISAVLRNSDGLHIFSIGEEHGTEREIVQRFFDGIERKSPDLVSWNGTGFDLPVLHYRALKHGVTAARYWEIGDADREFLHCTTLISGRELSTRLCAPDSNSTTQQMTVVTGSFLSSGFRPRFGRSYRCGEQLNWCHCGRWKNRRSSSRSSKGSVREVQCSHSSPRPTRWKVALLRSPESSAHWPQ